MIDVRPFRTTPEDRARGQGRPRKGSVAVRVLRLGGRAVGVVIVGVAFAACGAEAADPAVPEPTAPIPASVGSVAVSAAPDSTGLAPVNEVSASDEPGHGAYTVEDLADASDAVVLTSGVSVLDHVQLGGSGFLVAEFAIDRVLRGDSLAGASSVVAWVVDDVVPEASLTGRHVVFLIETPAGFDDEARDALERFGGRHLLLSGPLAVLDVDGGMVSSRDDSFQGLGSAFVVPPPSGSSPDATLFFDLGQRWDEPSLDDVIATIAGSGLPSPTPAPDPAAAPTSGSDVEAPASLAEMESAIPVVAVRTGPSESAGTYFGRSDPSGGAVSAAPGFDPAPGDERFCWAVEVINDRPQPIDEFEEVVVAGEYFRAIEPFAIADAVPHLRVLIAFTTSIAAQGSFTEADEVDESDPAAAAFAAMNTLVDHRCLGLA
jgi:hypothetical protein